MNDLYISNVLSHIATKPLIEQLAIFAEDFLQKVKSSNVVPANPQVLLIVENLARLIKEAKQSSKEGKTFENMCAELNKLKLLQKHFDDAHQRAAWTNSFIDQSQEGRRLRYATQRALIEQKKVVEELTCGNTASPIRDNFR